MITSHLMCVIEITVAETSWQNILHESPENRPVRAKEV